MGKPETSQRILDEDSYIDNIEHIITRDFYPDLYRLNKQNKNIDQYGTPGQPNTPTPIKQYKQHQLNKQQSNDTFENAVTPTPNQLNPTTQHTNTHISDNEDGDSSHYVNGETLTDTEKKQMQNLKLNQFHSIYTSEDNHSFSEIQLADKLKHFKKYSWIYDQQKNADDRKKYLSILKQNDPQNTIKSIELPTDSDTKSKYPNKSKSEIEREENKQKYAKELELQKKVNLYRGELEYWKFSAVNDLMFFPEADKKMNAEIMKRVRLYAKYGNPECIYSNTRLPEKFKLQEREENELSAMEQQCKGYEFVHTPQIEIANDLTPIALDENDQPKGPIFHIPKVPKKDLIVAALNKKKSDKMRKKQEEIRRYTPSENNIYTPYDTKSVLTPSGNRIDTPLVGQNTPNMNDRKRKRKKYKNVVRRRSTSIRCVDDLSPAARKLMERRMKGMNGLSTPLSSVLRDAYSETPKSKRKKRRRQSSVSSVRGIDTPQLNTPKQKKRKLSDSTSVFKKPTRSMKQKKKGSNITDGLL